jgi:hypothetical protein
LHIVIIIFFGEYGVVVVGTFCTKKTVPCMGLWKMGKGKEM